MICETIMVEGQGGMKLARFTGLAELADFALPDTFECVANWAGSTLKEAHHRAHFGNPALVPASDKLLATLEATNPPTSQFRTISGITGGAPCIPEYLAGNPVNMRLRRRAESQQAPIVVVVDCVNSSGIDHETIMRRGAACLALVRCLSASRPVTLKIIAGMNAGKNVCIAVDMDTAPLDLARAAWALGAPEFPRHICYTAGAILSGKPRNATTRWLFRDHRWQTGEKDGEGLAGFVAKSLGAEAHIAMPSIFLGTNFDSDEAAAAWVKATIAKATA